MDEKTQRAFSRLFCSDGDYLCLLDYINSGEPLTEIWDSCYDIDLEKWLQEKSISKEEVVKWLEKAVELNKTLEEKLDAADTLIAECEKIARGASLSFSMPRVSGVTFRVSEWGVGWNRSDYSC